VKKAKVLVVSADHVLHRLFRRSLRNYDYDLVCIDGDSSIIKELLRLEPDVLLLDDPSVCPQIRQHSAHLSIIVLSSITDQKYIAQVLDQGADDYVVQPFGTEELAARIRSHLRRAKMPMSQEHTPELLQSEDGYVSLFVARHKLWVGNKQVQLTKKEFALLQELMMHADKVLTHRSLLQAVWGPEYGEESDYLRVYMRQLRCKVEEDPSKPHYILTEPGVGYCFHSSSGGKAPKEDKEKNDI
jgi:two-component system, OmpR family, KDP operon response regulator KdpE